MGIHLVPAAAGERARVIEAAAEAFCGQPLTHSIAKSHLAAHGDQIERSYLHTEQLDIAADGRYRQFVVVRKVSKLVFSRHALCRLNARRRGRGELAADGVEADA